MGHSMFSDKRKEYVAGSFQSAGAVTRSLAGIPDSMIRRATTLERRERNKDQNAVPSRYACPHDDHYLPSLYIL